MLRISTLLFFLTILLTSSQAQMWNGTDTLYGNEWIDYDQPYYKIMVAQDGIYRLSKSSLQSAGVPVNEINGSRYQVFHMGQEIPVYVSTNLLFGSEDYLEFYGQKNRGEIDRYLYNEPDKMLNPEYSLVSDTVAYFLTYTDGGAPVSRFENVENDLNNLPSAEPFYMESALSNSFSTITQEVDSENVATSSFEAGEGMASTFNTSHEITLPASNVYSPGGNAIVKVRLATNRGSHQIELSFNNNTFENDAPNGYTFQEYSTEVSSGSLQESNTINVQSSNNDFDKTAVSNAWLIYPRSFDFNGENSFIFDIAANNSATYLEIDNFNSGSQSPVLYDVTNNIRIEATIEGGKVKIKLPASNQDRKLILSNQETGYTGTSADMVNFVDYQSVDANYIIISNPRFYNDGNGANYVNEYANYRSSTQGGAFNTVVIDVQQLYDQFGYGINRHFISIRNFGHFVKKVWSDPQYVFIIGKGRVFYQVRTDAQLNGSNAATFAVPTFGAPGADNLLMGTNSSPTPIIPIGRIAVSEAQDIKDYLGKVELMESGGGAQTIEDQLWKKRVLHLGGGNNTISEQTTIKNHLFDMENIIENISYGAEVTSFFKTSSDPIQLGDSDAIFNRINNGISILTFFGHSAVGTFDFNIDNPLRYENYGKYPLLISLGCFSGNIHTNVQGISERFVFLKDKGAVAFCASTGQGYITPLANFGKRYYQILGEDFYGESIGRCLQETIRSFEDVQSFSMTTLKEQFTLHGDPAIKIYPATGPDYVVSANSVSFAPDILTATLDSIDVTFSVTNLGYGILDSIAIEIEQELPNGEREIIVQDTVPTPRFEQYFTYTVPSFKKKSAGLNKLYIRLDTENAVMEMPDPAAEMNNELLNTSGAAGLAFYIFDDSARPVYPSKFGIVNDPSVTLKASTSDGLAPERKYIFQIDTTEFFNSPLKENVEIWSRGGVIKWDPNIAMVDDRVYYWRVSPDSLSPDAPYVWENSSFIFLEDEEDKGWNQSHYYQYQANESESITLNENREFQFPEKITNFRLKNKVFDSGNKPEGIINNAKWSDFYRWDVSGSLTIVVFSDEGSNDIFDGTYSHLWFNFQPGEYGSVNTTATRIASFPFQTTTQAERNNIIDFLENVVPDSAFVIAYTALINNSVSLLPEEWAADSTSAGDMNLFNLLESYGATQIRNLETEGTLPYVFAFKKSGDAIYEQVATDINGIIDFELAVPAIGIDGYFHSVDIGPAQEWDRLTWEFDGLEVEDSVFLTVYGVNVAGMQDSLFSVETMGEVDLSGISASQYPKINLRLYAHDKDNFSVIQLSNWRVLYRGLPEAAVASAEGFVFYNDTLQQGDQGNFELAIENISDYDMDSLLLKYAVVDALNNETQVFERIAPLNKDGIAQTQFSFDTREMKGLHNLVLEVNPNGDQAEQHHFNNFAIKQFFVESDMRNPLLDVTFDGTHILDGDIVSPRPNIHISLKDENEFLALSDTNLFKIFLKYPEEQVAENIPINHDWITFYPDSQGDASNSAFIEFRPVLTLDGDYELLIQAEDATGNQSGELDYKVNFEVITKSSLSNVLNYPNPFSTSTQFVYTLTGEEIPDFFKIQIFTASGRIVKEITQDELGPLKVGTHRTDYRWDGTDEYGDRLANGVYLYRVVAKKQGGETYDLFDTGTNSMFKKGFGKLVILR